MKHALIIVLLTLAGCKQPPPPQPASLVRVVSHSNGSGGGFNEQFIFKYPHTVVEDVSTGERWVMKGVLGEAGDTFKTVLVERANEKQRI